MSGAGARASAFFISDLVGEFFPDVRPDAFCTLQSIALTKIFARKFLDFLDRAPARRAPTTFWSFCQAFFNENFFRKFQKIFSILYHPASGLSRANTQENFFRNFQKIFLVSVPRGGAVVKGQNAAIFIQCKKKKKKKKKYFPFNYTIIFWPCQPLFYENFFKFSEKFSRFFSVPPQKGFVKWKNAGKLCQCIGFWGLFP